MWSPDKLRDGSSREGVLSGNTISPPPSLVPIGPPFPGGPISFHHATGASSPIPDHLNKKHSASSEEMKVRIQ